MRRSVFTLSLTAAAIAIASLFEPAAVRAAEVTLTSGSVVVNCPANPNSRTGTIQLNGPDFDLHFFYDGSSALCSPAPVFRGLSGGFAYDFSLYAVTFQGVTTMFTRGSLLFDETSISGTVEGTNSLFQPLFTVNFSGTGVGSFSPSKSTFEVGAVPEPATLALLATGAALFISGASRWRKARRRRDSGAELQG